MQTFEKEFQISVKEAQYLFKSSSFLMKDDCIAAKDINKICAKSKSKFTREQIDSMLSILSDVSNFDSHANEEQQEIITATKNYFQVMNNNKW